LARIGAGLVAHEALAGAADRESFFV